MKEHRCSNFSRKEKQQQQEKKANKQINKQNRKISAIPLSMPIPMLMSRAAAEISKWFLSSCSGLPMLIMSTFTMNVMYIRQSSGTMLINIPEQKKKNTQM